MVRNALRRVRTQRDRRGDLPKAKGGRGERRRQKSAKIPPDPPNKVAKLREVVHQYQNLQGRGVGGGFRRDRGGKGRSVILLNTPVGQI